MSHLCPQCEQQSLDTVATVPYVRGFLVAYQIGTKKFIGCQSCVRASIFKEVGLSALVGWFSITAFVINPFLILYGVFKGLTVKPDPAAVHALLLEAGVPAHPEHVNVLQVAYGLAAAMIAADGKIEASEVEAATRFGAQLFDGFDEQALMSHLQDPKRLPDPGDLASVLAGMLDAGQKLSVYRYLEAIAGADGEVADDEAALLVRIRVLFGLSDLELRAA